MSSTQDKDEIIAIIGKPEAVASELAEFQKTVRALSSNHPRMIDKYPRQWVAIYRGKVRATGNSLEDVLTEMDEKGLPRERTVVRFIEKNHRTMIL